MKSGQPQLCESLGTLAEFTPVTGRPGFGAGLGGLALTLERLPLAGGAPCLRRQTSLAIFAAVCNSSSESQ